MKRIYIAIAFLILAVTVGAFEMLYVSCRIDELNKEILTADSLVENENYDGAKEILAKAEEKWEKNLCIFDILLIHDYVDEISVNLSAMRKWAVQYALHAKILTPSSLVEGVKSDLVQALENYNTD